MKGVREWEDKARVNWIRNTSDAISNKNDQKGEGEGMRRRRS